MSNIFFISDLHLGHENIMGFGQRDFSCIEEHDEAIVQSWNAVVKRKDIVWVLGDVAMSTQSLKLFDRMSGRKKLIMGNHDKFDTGLYMKYFEDVKASARKYHGLFLTHIPIHPQEMSYRNWVTNIHGHIHHPERDIKDGKYFNVNVDIIGMIPISLDQLREKIKLKEEKYDRKSL